ncbi:O-antigen biosynthesis protein [freshwater metagenome]|uniref:O-antigen biosynthesis protein n=1 Tax=freshwater metagenome TaxID=449393 RepID=A0A094QCV7_9ZZZZ
MSKIKVVTIVGTRPEIIRLCRLIPKLDAYTDHILVHTGQNSDPKLNDVFFEDLELRQPDYFLNVNTSSMGSVMGDTIKKSEELFLKEKPDAVMILGDTNSAVAAIVAERMHIPVYHMEAGNRSFDANVPEELNRRMVDHVASFNLPYNDYSLRNLLAEGIHPRRICITGSPIREVYVHYKEKILSSSVLKDLELTKGEYFLASIHRQENVDPPERLKQVLECLRAVRDEWGLPVLVSTHPRTGKRLKELGIDKVQGITFHEPFGYLDYNHLQMNARCVISDSGTISEESAIIGFPAVSLRDSLERPESLDAGSIVLAGIEPENLINSILVACSHYSDASIDKEQPAGYQENNFSQKVVSFLVSTAFKHAKWAGIRSLR